MAGNGRNKIPMHGIACTCIYLTIKDWKYLYFDDYMIMFFHGIEQERAQVPGKPIKLIYVYERFHDTTGRGYVWPESYPDSRYTWTFHWTENHDDFGTGKLTKIIAVEPNRPLRSEVPSESMFGLHSDRNPPLARCVELRPLRDQIIAQALKEGTPYYVTRFGSSHQAAGQSSSEGNGSTQELPENEELDQRLSIQILTELCEAEG